MIRKSCCYLLCAFVCLAASALNWRELTSTELTGAEREPRNWLTYSGDYRGWRNSALNLVNQGNVNQLGLRWLFNNGQTAKLEATPLVIDGVMYLPLLNNEVYALDARTGRQLWVYRRPSVLKLSHINGGVNRGLAVLGKNIFLATLDARVIALDTRTGSLVWETKAAEPTEGYYFTVAPLVVKDKVIVGVSGGNTESGALLMRTMRQRGNWHGTSAPSRVLGSRAMILGKETVGRPVADLPGLREHLTQLLT